VTEVDAVHAVRASVLHHENCSYGWFENRK
jgi:hypothetical protein